MKLDPEILFFAFFAMVLSILGYTAFSALTASGNIAYCYVEQTYDRTFLKGKIYWRTDIYITEASSVDEIIHIANKLHCKLWAEAK